ncbi:hypothetical protein RhiJN_26859 [Ceratobasidium sp. AG-Ba]|nr:hypothetical protein RhiJN_12810 [Ceratobasidium sp. AG-Ba]QRV98840.1 hypothetical protein RhiJN_26859 [Ceratobasidium sp. AG-Ba]
MADPVVDIEQMAAAPLPAPSTSRTPAPRIASSTPSTRHSTPTPAPRPHAPVPRVTRSRAAATASASGSRQRSGVPAGRNHLHHAANAPVKREPSSSLSPPPEIVSQESTNDRPRSLEPSLPAAESSQGNAYQDVSQSAVQDAQATPTDADQIGSVSSSLVDSTSILPWKDPSTAAPGPDSPSTLLYPNTTSLPPKVQKKRKPRTPDSESEDQGLPLLSEERRSRRRHAPPASRTLANGIGLPTQGEDMVDLDALIDRDASEGETIDVDKEDDSEEVQDASRSGVIGLELLTMASL